MDAHRRLRTSYLIQIIAEFVEAVPNHMRGQALGVLTSGLLAMQGVGLLVAGLLAQAFTITTTIAICGFAAVVFASPLALGRRIYGAHSVHSPTRKPEQTAAW